MKKILFILFICFAVKLSAQNIWFIDTTAAGVEKRVYLGTMDQLRNGTWFAPMPVQIKSSVLPSGGASAQNQTNGSQKTQIVNSSGVELFNTTTPAIISNISGYRDTTITVIFDSTASLSGAINLGNRRIKGIRIPTGWGTANLTFQSSEDAGVTYQNLYADDVELLMTAPASTILIANPRYFIGRKYLKIRSGTSGVPVTQNGAVSTRTLLITIGNY